MIDLNEIPLEESPLDIEKDGCNIEEEGECKSLDLDEPFVGQCFLSEEEAFVFYQNYAKRNGFAIRKGRFVNKNGEKSRRDFFCHREGKSKVKMVDYSKQQRNRGSTVGECKAHMCISLRRINDIFPKEWQVTKFVLEHNHDLLSPQEVRFLPSYRSITSDDEKRIFLLKEGGLSIRQIMRVMELEKSVRHGELDFLTKDVSNLIIKNHKLHSNNDARELLEYCKNAKTENSNFQYAFKLDADNRLEHIFWSHAHCFDMYQEYGDVVVFDTTYKVNSYDMPFGIFVGVDNHGRTILFGCALLRDETTTTFEWLFKHDQMTQMARESPQTILTDQDQWMTNAIAKEIPSAKHAFCIWHITTKFSSWFMSVLRSEYSSWCSEFYTLYKLDTVEEFEQHWPLVIEKYNLSNNKHVVGLYKIKSFWVPAYLREFFFGGMTTTGRSESINAFIKKFISSRTCLSDFIKQVDLAVEDVHQKQIHDTMLQKYRGSYLRSLSPLEEQGYRFLTPFSFKKFQEQFGLAMQYSVERNQYSSHEENTVAKCTCKNFEFVGILCRHILSVFIHEGCFEVPSNYWHPRWRRKDTDVVAEWVYVLLLFLLQTIFHVKRKFSIAGEVNTIRIDLCPLCGFCFGCHCTTPNRYSCGLTVMFLLPLWSLFLLYFGMSNHNPIIISDSETEGSVKRNPIIISDSETEGSGNSPTYAPATPLASPVYVPTTPPAPPVYMPATPPYSPPAGESQIDADYDGDDDEEEIMEEIIEEEESEPEKESEPTVVLAPSRKRKEPETPIVETPSPSKRLKHN
ncbi:protein FAR1-RELATED SEQUENCE 11-like [Rutidosis leptorrhynchoides]|uniref:protein FAR1-RELATED SEQUENCE 11-like n=1 Tax=Rutidosis leptorrhynchoides TaxID=125765 RepID=UPI003A98DAE0